MKKSRLEPFEILTANKRSNPLFASRETEAMSEPDADREKPVETSRQADNPGSSRPASTAGLFWNGIVRRKLITLRVTPLMLAVIGFCVITAAGVAFLGGFRAGTAEIRLPEPTPADSFDAIRRNRVVLFDDLEVDRGQLRR